MPINPSDYKLKVIIGLPFAGGSRYVSPEWALALAAFGWPMNCRYAFYPVKGKPREVAREQICEKAVQMRAQYVGMLDDDIQPPLDVWQALIRELDSRPDEFAAIGAVCPSMAHEPMVFLQPEMGPHWRWKKGDVFECAEIATACILIRTSALAKIPQPWFRDLNTVEECLAAGTLQPNDEYLADDQLVRSQVTDDIYFCRKLQAAGLTLLAHGGCLPVHWDRNGNTYELPPDSYPFQSYVDGTKVQIDSSHLNISRALKIAGWMSQEELTWLADQTARPDVSRIAEIGSWHGRSTRAFADNIVPGGVVYAIDTWRGSPEIAGELKGMPEDWAFEQFKANLEDHIGRDGNGTVRVMHTESQNAAAMFEPADKFDLIFIDADHSYANCRADILAWRPLLRPGGMLCGHDYAPGWDGVIRAVNELVPGAKHGPGSIWYSVVEHNG